MPLDDAAGDVPLPHGSRCAQCGRTDVDDQWLWLCVERAADDDCEFDSVDLEFCSQDHAGLFLRESEIDWHRVAANDASGVRVDRFFLGCGLLAIILSVIGLIALIRWIF